MHDRFILLKRYRDLDAHELLVLEPWLKNFKDLGTAYQLKEQFYDIWNSRSRREALERYQEWRSQIPEQLEAAFRLIRTAVSNSSPTSGVTAPVEYDEEGSILDGHSRVSGWQLLSCSVK